MIVVHSTSITNSTIITTDNAVKLGITLPKSTIQNIDQKRGDIPRSRYIRRAVERYLGSTSKDIDSMDNKAMAATKKSRRK